MEDGLIFCGAAELAARIRARDVSPVEVVRALRERAEAVNPVVNALVTPIESAEDRARAAEAALSRGDDVGPLHGVPFTIKDSFDVAGVRTTRGSELFAHRVAERDATVVARLVAAGGIPLAKTNLPEFALWWETDSVPFGRTVNPWDPSRTAGGSSGGEAAAVAAGLSPLGIGSDLGGSIRLPAHYCGVLGLKPTHGRIPLGGHWPEVLLRFMHAGFLARSADDIALALAVASGPDGEDPYAVPVAPPGPLEHALGPLRVGLVVDDFGPVEPEVRTAVERAGRALAELGCTVAAAGVPGLARHDWNATTMTLYSAAAGRYFQNAIAGRDDALHPALRRRLGARVESLAEYVAAEDAVEELRHDLAGFFRDHDLMLCPTVPLAAHPHDALEVTIDGERYTARSAMRATIPWDLTGSPALSVPFAWSSEGLPLGVQLVGRHFEDALVLEAGAALDGARDDPGRRPAFRSVD